MFVPVPAGTWGGAETALVAGILVLGAAVLGSIGRARLHRRSHAEDATSSL
ncbi:MAG: hypothetical protein LC624_07675 [Halobacteriales archaeon]|nr:hypothetical protein [Halobacteriales archaeon]